MFAWVLIANVLIQSWLVECVIDADAFLRRMLLHQSVFCIAEP